MDSMVVEPQGVQSTGDMGNAAKSVGVDMGEEKSSAAAKSPPMSKGISSLHAQAEEGAKKA